MGTSNFFKKLSIGTAERPYSYSSKVQPASTIVTIPSWGSIGYAYPFGESDVATCGQTFTAGSHNILENFSFWLGGYAAGSSLTFAAYLMRWDGCKATGDILYQSDRKTKAPTEEFEEFVFDTRGVLLEPGQKYVVFLSASEFFSGTFSQTGIGYLVNGSVGMNVYPGGGFVYQSSGSNFNRLTSLPWMTIDMLGLDDAAFQAKFSSLARL